MAELARGTVADRPWGKTLGALGLRGLSGQLTLTSDGKRYQVAFAHGAVINAASPLASDAAARVALTSGLMSSTQVADIARKHSATPGRDEVEVIAELVRLTPDQALRLRRRVVAQRAARTFSIDRGEFVVEDRVTIPFFAGTEMDVRGVIYLGARQMLSEARLDAELAMFGTSFRLRSEAVEDLPQFGFGEAERPLFERLRIGAALSELARTGLDPRMVRAAVYALASCNACDIEGAPQRTVPVASSAKTADLTRAARAAVPAASRPVTPPPPIAARPAIAPPTAARIPPVTVGAPEDPTVFRPRQPEPATVRREVDPKTTLRRPPSAPPPRRRVDSAQASDVQQLIEQRLALLDRRANHFELLGVAVDVSPEELRKVYFALARQLHPDRLAALGIADDNRRAQRLFAEVNAAFAELSDPARRYEYTEIVKRGGAAAVAAEQAEAEEMAARVVAAEEAFRRGEAALRRDQLGLAATELKRAMELNPDEADYVALHAWAQFCASPDKMAIADATRAALDRAILQSPRAVTARFYLGRVERMLGRDREALEHFKAVLQRRPGHAEAGSEARVIEARLAAGSGDKDKGLFGRLKR